MTSTHPRSDRTLRLQFPAEVDVIKVHRNENETAASEVGGDFCNDNSETIIGFIDSPSTGRRLFRIELTVPDEFDVDSDLKIKAGDDGRCLTVHGTRRTIVSSHDGHQHSQQLQLQQQVQISEFSRQIKLPENVDINNYIRHTIPSKKKRRTLVIDFPIKTSNTVSEGKPRKKTVLSKELSCDDEKGIMSSRLDAIPSSSTENSGAACVKNCASISSSSTTAVRRLAREKHPLNIPVIEASKSDDGGVRTMTLLADVGRMFRADDVVVRLRSRRRLLIVAETSETTPISQLTARIVRQFDLPADVDRKSLVACFSDDGLVHITARLLF